MARAMKDSGIEWIGEIPEEWKRVKLGFLYSFSSGNTLTAQDFDDRGDYPVFGANGLRGYYNSYNTSGKHILIGRVGALCGNIHLINSEVWVTEHALISEKLSSLVTDEFSVYLLTAMGLRQYASGTAQPVIAAEKIRKLSVPLPPMNEQQRIANHLDSECVRIDMVIEQTRASIEEYKKLKQSVITQAVTKGIRPGRKMKDSGIEWVGEIPEDWGINTFFQFFTQVKNKNSNLHEQNLLSLSYGKIKRKRIESTEGLLPESFDGYNIIEADDIVLRLTDLQNDQKSLRVGISTERGIVTSAYVTIRNRSESLPRYLYYCLHCFDVSKGFYGMGGGIRQGLNWDGLKWIKLLTPPKEEQTEIVRYCDTKSRQIDTVISGKERLVNELESYKKSLIFEYVTGKMEVQHEQQR